jgi:hypothetical protein
MIQKLFMALLLLGVMTACAVAANVTLVDNGAAKVCVVVAAGADQNLQWAGEDLATYLGKMSGAKVQVGTAPVQGMLPIYVGCAPEKPAMTAKSEFGDAYLIDVSDQRIVVQGESTRSTYYAAAQLLYGLGVRWYAPGDLGECVPKMATVAVAAGRTESAPDFQERQLWAGGDNLRWALRNRLGGPAMAQGHGFYGLMEGEKYFNDHPEYFPIQNGKPVKTQANLSSDAVAELFAKNIAEQFKHGTTWAGGTGACVGPDDGLQWTNARKPAPCRMARPTRCCRCRR